MGTYWEERWDIPAANDTVACHFRLPEGHRNMRVQWEHCGQLPNNNVEETTMLRSCVWNSSEQLETDWKIFLWFGFVRVRKNDRQQFCWKWFVINNNTRKENRLCFFRTLCLTLTTSSQNLLLSPVGMAVIVVAVTRWLPKNPCFSLANHKPSGKFDRCCGWWDHLKRISTRSKSRTERDIGFVYFLLWQMRSWSSLAHFLVGIADWPFVFCSWNLVWNWLVPGKCSPIWNHSTLEKWGTIKRHVTMPFDSSSSFAAWWRIQSEIVVGWNFVALLPCRKESAHWN